MDIDKERTTIWFPHDELYEPRVDGGYATSVQYVPTDMLIEFVQRRAKEDGEWLIANGLVGENNENEDKMRRMMEFVANPKNVRQCYSHVHAEKMEAERTIDWVCRELANASRFMIR